MMDEPEFTALLGRVRAGDEEAAARLVRQFEPEVRRVVRGRLTDPYLRRLVDSGDICQSVLANFFVRAALGQFQLDRPEHLVRLLVTMARNRVLNLARDRRREKAAAAATPDLAEAAADLGPSASHAVSCRELAEKARAGLPPDVRRVADLRSQGRGWDEIAAALGQGAEKLRKQYARALERVARQLGLDTSAGD